MSASHHPVVVRARVSFQGAAALGTVVGALVLVLAAGGGSAAAAGDVGAVTKPTVDRIGIYRPPVSGPVIDPFRPPSTPYGPGNRGLEYGTRPGEPVRAIGGGRVAFAGPVAGRWVVSIDHPDGLRSALVGLAVVVVRRGQAVAIGQVVGRAGAVVHLGVRRGGQYLDPARLFAPRGPARLVPLGELGASFGAPLLRR